ncbi:MAG: hypothetical protein ACLFN5_04000, partial [bacterium]
MTADSGKNLIEVPSYTIRNRGPWVTVEYDIWSGFSLGQTTALADGAGTNFSNPCLRNLFFSLFELDSFHQPR